MHRIVSLAAVLVLVAAACSSDAGTDADDAATSLPSELASPPGEGAVVPPAVGAIARNQLGYQFPAAPAVPTGDPDPALTASIDRLFGSLQTVIDLESIGDIGASGDPRAAWILSDLLRFLGPSTPRAAALRAFEDVTGVSLADDPVADRSEWQSVTDHLIGWDTPALPDYQRWKGDLFTIIDDRWEPFFRDEGADIDWRLLSWGGVLIDDRNLGDSLPCARGCIPALDDPSVTDASGGDWYPDDAVVFGVTINGESRAYPKNIMEIHEMVNDTVGGRRVGIPYCTLCGSAQAYFTDSVPDGVEVPVLRTSGLLTRSNKVMYDLNTFSVFDTFTGAAVSGPLLDERIVLDQTTVVTSTWADWRAAHPETSIVAQDGGIGRSYAADPLGGRDDNGAIFPIGDVDERLGVQDKVLGVFTSDGTPLAFSVEAARRQLDEGAVVEALGVIVVADGSGVRAIDAEGNEVVGHEAFWFAWSQFHPDTVVWAS